MSYRDQFAGLFGRNPQLSDIKPSVWAEQHVVVPGKGKVDYNFNPYCREIIDRLAPDDPARKIAVMKGSQITFSSGVIMPALAYTIKEDPHNTFLMVGTSELVEPAVEKLDLTIQGAELEDYIGSQVVRRANRKSGDTDVSKSFPGGYIKVGSPTNSKSIAQVDLGRIFLDDFDAMKGQWKEGGSFMDLIEMRAASKKNDYKLMMISTPLRKATSNIEPAFMAGDRRRYMLECPCCHEPILLKWEVPEGEVLSEITGEKAACPGGIVYETNQHRQVKKKSVGYVCYKCGGWFDDGNKQAMLRAGVWTPTAVAVSEDYFSYHISSLYAPVGMFDWFYYAQKHSEANVPGQPVNEAKMQVLMNTCWGETYEQVAEKPEANSIMANIRGYEPGMIPEAQSIADGSGRIVLLTCAADMNGKMKGYYGATEDDVRLDYEIRAWAESGSYYSLWHGSLGTFASGMKDDPDSGRVKWSYQEGQPNSVWPELDKILDRTFETDTGRKMGIFMTGLDCGVYTTHAYTYLDKRPGKIVGLKGDKEQKFQNLELDKRLFWDASERNDLYMLQVGKIKDRISEYMRLKWRQGDGDQPSNFMNFPMQTGGLYGYEGYFKHFESEHKAPQTSASGDTLYLWKKVRSDAQNHFWDCAVYNFAVRDIVVALIYKAAKQQLGAQLKKKYFTWGDYVDVVLGRFEAR